MILNFIKLSLIFIGCCLSTYSQNSCIDVPKGDKILIDGTINLKEWEKSYILPLHGGEFVKIQRFKDTLFIAVKGKAGGFCSLAIGNDNGFKILHSSTGLITAEYIILNDAWKLVHDFKEPLNVNGKKYSRGSVRLTPEYRKSKLKQFGWYANLIEMGDYSETEYAIPLTELQQKKLFISVVFFQIKAEEKVAKLPSGLDDDCLNKELISGSARNGLQFKPNSWLQIKI